MEQKEKGDILEHEVRELQQKLAQTAAKLQKAENDLDLNTTQLGYDVEHYRNLYEELKITVNKNDK